MKATVRCVLGVVAVLVAGLALAQSFPARQITIVVPFATGAANDVMARLLAEHLREPLGPVLVDNRPGGNAITGTEHAKRAKPDGHTILLGGNTFLMAAAIGTAGSIDIARDFEPIALVARLPFYLVVNREEVPVDSVREFVEFARARPGKLAYATPGNAMPHHFGAELLKLQAGLDLLHVPYKGMAQGALDLIGGRVQLTITGYPAIAPHAKSGKLRVLANAGGARSALLPEVPTLAEAGIPGVSVDSWVALFAPVGSPREAITRLNAEINAVLAKPALRQTLGALGFEPAGGAPEVLLDLTRAESERWRRVAGAAGIKPD